MTQQQAWEVLSRATAQVQANRQVHQQIMQALEVLKPVEPKEEEK